jgi:diguanylate cyclase (GGDEF)-like protein
MYIDLDGFKPINDNYGHDVGDGVLRQFAERLQEVVRECDLVARVGGDEFVVAGGELSDAEAALDIAQRILNALARPMAASSARSLSVRASIGIAIYPDIAQSRDTLLSAADVAMYVAKRAGGNTARLSDLPNARVDAEVSD